MTTMGMNNNNRKRKAMENKGGMCLMSKSRRDRSEEESRRVLRIDRGFGGAVAWNICAVRRAL